MVKELTREDKIKASADKMPPIDVEKVVLGSILIDNDQIVNIFNIINADMFCYEVNSKIYNTMLHLFENKMKIDRVTLWQAILNAGYNSPQLTEEYISSLAEGDRIFRASYAQYYAMSIAERYGGERGNSIFVEIGNIGKENKRMSIPQSIEILHQYSQKLEQYTKKPETFEKPRIDENEIMDLIQDKIDSNKLTGLPSGIWSLDYAIDGFEKKRLTSLISASSAGKTTLSNQIVLYNAKLGQDCLICSGEMSHSELSFNLALMSAGLHSGYIQKPREAIENLINKKIVLNYAEGINYIREKINFGKGIIENLPITIYRPESLNIDNVHMSINKYLMQNKKLDFVVVDNTEIMIPNVNPASELPPIYRALKNYTVTYNIAILVLHQFNRAEIAKSIDYMPSLYAIKGSTAIENNSDVIIFIYRPSLYDNLIKEKPHLKDVNQFIIAKRRNGAKPDPIDIDFKNGLFVDKFQITGVELI